MPNALTNRVNNIMSNALMNKNKKELVDIIFRKDDIHKKLKQDNKDLNDKIKNLNEIINNKNTDLAYKNNDIANLITQVNEYTDMCDEYATKYFEIIDKCKNFKRLSVINTCITIAVLISMLILL